MDELEERRKRQVTTGGDYGAGPTLFVCRQRGSCSWERARPVFHVYFRVRKPIRQELRRLRRSLCPCWLLRVSFSKVLEVSQ